jgi:hypothetical protein
MQNRVQETTTTGGTGTITLAGAVTGYITFAAGFTTGDVLFYTIDNGIGEWEIGIGTLVTTGTLSRTTVIASSNSGALVNFSSGTKRVFCSAPTRSLVPDQDSKSGYVLTTDGTNPSWTQTLNSVNIGNTTAGTGAFTTLSASSTVSGTGFSNYLASPPAIGGSSPAAGNFTNLSYTGTLTGGTGVINIGSGQIVKDASGNVGIGTSIPNTATRLHVANSNIGTLGVVANAMVTTTDAQGLNVGGVLGLGGSVTTGSPSLNMRLFGAIKGAKEDSVDGSTAGYLSFFTMGSFTTTPIERLRIDSSGNVGIGTSSLSEKLTIASSTATATYTRFQNTLGSGLIGVGGANTLEIANTSSGVIDFYTSATKRMTLSATGVLTLGSAISLDPTTANALVVNSSGNVGIGTSSPLGKLNVSNAGAAGLEFYTTNPSGGVGTYIQSFNRSGGAYVETHYYATSHAFRTSASATTMVLNASGNVLVGSTSDPGGSNKLRVANSILSDLAIGSGAHFDTSNATRLSVGTSSNALLVSGSGYHLVLVAETAQTGNTALFLLGNGVVVLISQSGGAWVASTTPSTTQFSIGFSGGNYRLYNGFNTGSGYAFSASIIRCWAN